ncbi:MAG TPA: O-antigen ligase family protein [Paenibacillus sp.]
MKLILILLFGYTVPTLINLVISGDKQILFNILLTCMYIYFLFITTKVIVGFNYFHEFTKVFRVSILIFICLVVFINGLDLLNITNIQAAFNLEERLRQTYGLRHPNTLGNLCFIYIVLTLYKFTYLKMTKLITCLDVGATGLVVIVMLTSGSRTALSASFLFLILFALNKVVFFRSQIVNRVSILFTALILLGTTLVSLNYIKGLDYKELLSNTNRYYNWIYTLDYLKFHHMNPFTGLGYYNISYFYNVMEFSAKLMTDNWYILTYITVGYIGLFIFFVVLSIIIHNFMTYRDKYKDRYFSFFISLLIVCMYYSVFEVMLFVPSELLSLLLWISILYNFERMSNLSADQEQHRLTERNLLKAKAATTGGVLRQGYSTVRANQPSKL